MKRFLPCCIILVLVLLCAPLVAAQTPDQPDSKSDDESERILSFDSLITVNDDGSMLVKETIKVRSTGEQMKRGIYRDFPTEYVSKFLRLRDSKPFEVVSVRRDGKAEPYRSEDHGSGQRIYFGSADYLLPPGIHVYEFAYRTDRQLRFFPDHDEVYWNVNGNAWLFPSDVVAATVVLPARVRNLVTELNGYTGYGGEKGKAYTATRDRESNPVFRARDLAPQQNLSISVSWPKGLIPAPTSRQRWDWFVTDNKGIVIGAIGMAVVLIYFLVVWTMVGRDPAAGTIVPLYEPQDNMSPAGMRYLERMGFDDKVFTVAILGLAARGYLKIEMEESKTYRLVRKPGYGPLESQLSPEEKVLANKLFEEGATLYLSREKQAVLERAKKALQLSLQRRMERTYFFTNGRYLWPGVGLTAATAVGALVSGGGSSMAVGLFMSVWLSGWTVGVCALLFGVIHAWRSVSVQGVTAIPGALGISLFSLPFIGGEGVGVFMLWVGGGTAVVAIIFSGIGISLLFHYLLKAPTRAGRQLMDRVEGFRLFLKTVDGDRLTMMGAPAKTPELFERFLPYAVALGVEHAWADQFSQVLAAAAGAQQGSSGYSPSWYGGVGVATFSAASFTSSFSDSFSSALSSASAPASSSSSGSGGGGSSGGGGGGGGGGGW